jgi:hypothetical protein
MSLGHSASQTGLQLAQRFPRSALREKGGVDFLGGMGACAPDHDPLTILFPLED